MFCCSLCIRLFGAATFRENRAVDPFEVADVFEAPLSFLLDPGNQQRVARSIEGRRRDYWAIPWQDRYIWGATAAMLLILDRTLRAPD